MKISIFLILLIFFAVPENVFSQKRKAKSNISTDTLKVDSLEYRLIILDPGFEAWLATQPSKQFYSNEYYHQRNRIYVAEWNHRYMTSPNNMLYETYIDYNPHTDYGLDLNYKLYYYFRYFEESNGIKLYPGRH